jgi:hypothetical protein
MRNPTKRTHFRNKEIGQAPYRICGNKKMSIRSQFRVTERNKMSYAVIRDMVIHATA